MVQRRHPSFSCGSGDMARIDLTSSSPHYISTSQHLHQLILGYRTPSSYSLYSFPKAYIKRWSIKSMEHEQREVAVWTLQKALLPRHSAPQLQGVSKLLTHILKEAYWVSGFKMLQSVLNLKSLSRQYQPARRQHRLGWAINMLDTVYSS